MIESAIKWKFPNSSPKMKWQRIHTHFGVSKIQRYTQILDAKMKSMNNIELQLTIRSINVSLKSAPGNGENYKISLLESIRVHQCFRFSKSILSYILIIFLHSQQICSVQETLNNDLLWLVRLGWFVLLEVAFNVTLCETVSPKTCSF